MQLGQLVQADQKNNPYHDIMCKSLGWDVGIARGNFFKVAITQRLAGMVVGDDLLHHLGFIPPLLIKLSLP